MPAKRTISAVPEIVSRINDGATVFHRHPQREEIFEILALYALAHPSDRVSLSNLETQIATEYNMNLPGNGQRIKQFMHRYIFPAAVIEPQWVKEGIMKAESDLNIPKRKLQIADRLQRRFEAESRNRDTGASEVATLGRAALDALKESEESLTRFDMYPSKKKESKNTNIEVDLKGVLEQMMGHKTSPGASKDGAGDDSQTIDVDGGVVEEDE